MPSKSHRKAARKPRRSPDGRFKGEPRTLSETSMPDEYAPGAEAPREGPGGAGGVGQITHTPKRAVKAECPGGYFYTVTYVGKPRPWYRRLWAAVREWMR